MPPTTGPTLEGAFNFRDLGGLPRKQGGRIRLGRVFRSDTLQMLTSTDTEVLVGNRGIRTVVDLRLASEVSEEGRGPLGACQQVRYINSPLEMASAEGIPRGQILDHLYARCLASPSLPQAITAIAEHVDHPILFHCAAGKDRTGVVAAVLLELMDVETEFIVVDYMRSRDAMPRIVERFESWPRYREHMAAMPPEVYRVAESSIRRLLTSLDVEYGGARNWAMRRGISPSSLARLDHHLVDAG